MKFKNKIVQYSTMGTQICSKIENTVKKDTRQLPDSDYLKEKVVFGDKLKNS